MESPENKESQQNLSEEQEEVLRMSGMTQSEIKRNEESTANKERPAFKELATETLNGTREQMGTEDEYRELMDSFVERTGGRQAQQEVADAREETEGIKKDILGTQENGDGQKISEEELQMSGLDPSQLKHLENFDKEVQEKGYAEKLSRDEGLMGREYADLYSEIHETKAESPEKSAEPEADAPAPQEAPRQTGGRGQAKCRRYGTEKSAS